MQIVKDSINANSIYITIIISLKRFNKYELYTYVDNGYFYVLGKGRSFLNTC